MNEFLKSTDWVLPLALIAGGFIVGLVFERIILTRLKKVAARTKWEGDEIVRIADEEKVDLIVIATHGETGFRHLIFGSVTEKLVRLASCPVLTIPILHKEA